MLNTGRLLNHLCLLQTLTKPIHYAWQALPDLLLGSVSSQVGWCSGLVADTSNPTDYILQQDTPAGLCREIQAVKRAG